MTDLHIEHLLLRYEGRQWDGDRLRDIVERAMELAALRLDAPRPAVAHDGAAVADFGAMTDESAAEFLAGALIGKLELGD